MLMEFHELHKVLEYLSMVNVHQSLGEYPWINSWLIWVQIRKQYQVNGLRFLAMESQGVTRPKTGAPLVAQLITR
jgi:hypothetical protein